MKSGSTIIIGEYTQKLGDKNRVAFPKKFRMALQNEMIITKGYEGCCIILSSAQWEEMISDSVSGPFVSRLVRDTRRFLMASATEIKLDAQGRFIIPQYLLEYAQIKKECVFLGLGNWVEMWDLQIWEAKSKDLESKGVEIAEKLVNIKPPDKNG